MQNQTGGALYKGTLDCVTKTVKNEVGIYCFLIIRIFAASILVHPDKTSHEDTNFKIYHSGLYWIYSSLDRVRILVMFYWFF